MIFDLTAFLPRAVMQGIPLLYGSTGEILTEKSGNLNLGIPGVMYVGGICGVIARSSTSSPPRLRHERVPRHRYPDALLAFGFASDGPSLLPADRYAARQPERHGSCTHDVRVGIGNFFGGSLIKLTDSEVPSIALSATSAYFSKSLNVAAGSVRFSCPTASLPTCHRHRIVRVVLPQAHRTGLHLRAVGESASTADAPASTSPSTSIWPPASAP